MTEHVVVVGGGFTGLVAARALARQGLRVTLLESSPALGGLAAGFPICGTRLEKAYHYILTGDTDLLALIRDLGLDSELIQREGSVGIFDGTRTHPFTTALDVLRFAPLNLIDRLRLGLAMVRLQRTRRWQPLARQTARDWLARACGPDAMRAIWNPLLQGKFDRHWDQVSMAWLWARIHTRANSRRRGREWLGYVRGGFARLISALDTELRGAGVALRTSARVARLETSAPRQLHLTDGTTLHYDRLLFTGPSGAFARLLPPDPALDGYRAQLDAIDYLGAICLVFASTQALTEQHWVNIHDPEAPFLVLVNHTRLVGTDLYAGKHVYYLGCYRPPDSPWFQLDDATLTKRWLDYLKKINPAFDRQAITEHHVFRFSHAQHVVTCDHESRVPGFRTPLPGVYLANFSQIFPEDRGTNFAIRDGLKVAKLIIEDSLAQI